jgi:hypothetical protein
MVKNILIKVAIPIKEIAKIRKTRIVEATRKRNIRRNKKTNEKLKDSYIKFKNIKKLNLAITNKTITYKSTN